VSLWLCLRFEQLPLQCLNRSEEQPVVVLARQRVLRTNDCAAALGIREGMGGWAYAKVWAARQCAPWRGMTR
jgi:protein ImuB